MLAAAVKRKLLLFHYDDKDFVELREVSLPDPPLCADLVPATTSASAARARAFRRRISDARCLLNLMLTLCVYSIPVSGCQRD